MSDIPEIPPPLPTLDNLNATVPEDLDVKQVAKTWFALFSTAALSKDAQAVAALFIPDCFWRDVLAFTWDFRTFQGTPTIAQFLSDRLAVACPTGFTLRDDTYLSLQRPFPDLAWINFMFDFETTAGIGSGIARLVPTASGEWKAYGMFTNLEDLRGFPEKIGALRSQVPNHGKWEANRRREFEFENGVQPTVLIIGGGQCGLNVAARLKALEVPTLVVEKNERIGDNWRNRYQALCLHTPVYCDHMSYVPFPPTWPVFAPALKLANWFEMYAEALEINVWTSSTVVSAIKEESSSEWRVVIKRGDGTERTFDVKHLIFATGYGGTKGSVPSVPGKEKFKGKALHSREYKKAESEDYKGKKVVVVGACNSAHDIAVDCYKHEIDVTMYQRSSTHVMSAKHGHKVMMKDAYSENSPPTEISDRFWASFPYFPSIGIMQRNAKIIADLDGGILDALQRRGFRLNNGIHDTGVALLIWNNAGGYYVDTGGSQLIADGKIKLKTGGQIESFTEDGLKFDDGSELKADVVIFATGLGDHRSHIRAVCGEEVAKKCLPVWGLNKEGEIKGTCRSLGVKGLWYMMGSLASSRFYSKHVALQIKAMEEGIFNGERYSFDE